MDTSKERPSSPSVRRWLGIASEVGIALAGMIAASLASLFTHPNLKSGVTIGVLAGFAIIFIIVTLLVTSLYRPKKAEQVLKEHVKKAYSDALNRFPQRASE